MLPPFCCRKTAGYLTLRVWGARGVVALLDRDAGCCYTERGTLEKANRAKAQVRKATGPRSPPRWISAEPARPPSCRSGPTSMIRPRCVLLSRCRKQVQIAPGRRVAAGGSPRRSTRQERSEEHTSELQS